MAIRAESFESNSVYNSFDLVKRDDGKLDLMIHACDYIGGCDRVDIEELIEKLQTQMEELGA